MFMTSPVCDKGYIINQIISPQKEYVSLHTVRMP